MLTSTDTDSWSKRSTRTLVTRTHAAVCVAVRVAVMAVEPLAGIRVAMAPLVATASSKAAGAKTRVATATNSRLVDGVTRAVVTEPQPATVRQPADMALRTVGMAADTGAAMARRKVAWEAAERCVAVPVVVAVWAEDAAADEAEGVAHLTKACVGLTIKTSLEFLSQTFS